MPTTKPAAPSPLLQALAGFKPNQKIHRRDLQSLVKIADANGVVSQAEKTIIGDFFVAKERKDLTTGKASDYYRDELVKNEGFPKVKALKASIDGGA